MTKWTVEQQKAIEHRHQNILVSAAAGSGKTAVLVERMIRLILDDKVDVDKMLVVTFTNAAATEMRTRIQKALEDSMTQDNVDREFLSRQMNLLYRAKIMTLHKFCIELVREHFYIVDIEPTFRIANASEIQILIAKIVDIVMENAYLDARSTFFDLVEMYSNNRNDEEIRKWIIGIYRFIQSQPNPLEWLKQQMAVYALSSDLLCRLENDASDKYNGDNDEIDNFFNQQLWSKQLLKWAISQINKAISSLEMGIGICQQYPELSPYMETLYLDVEFCHHMMEACQKGWNEAYRFAKGMKLSTLKKLSKDAKQYLELEIIDEVKSIRNDIVKKKFLNPVMDILKMKSPMEHIMELANLSDVAYELYELIRTFDEEFTKVKKEKNILDFNDLEHYAIDILSCTDIASAYKNEFDYVFMDEYQDVNLVQESIINKIKRDDNLFLVGDVKQSIYRFRLADSYLFLDKYHRYAIDTNEKDILLHLTKNFRTRAEILDGINDVFEHLMISNLAEISYDEKARLNAGINADAYKQSPMEFYIIDKQSKQELSEEVAQISDMEVEAHLVAKRIIALLNEKIYDVKKNSWRNVSLSDIAILMRTTKGWSTIFADVLSKYGISVSSDASEEQSNTLEVEIFISLLKIIDNLYQDIPLLTVLRSAITDFSIEEIAQIRKKYPHDNFYKAFILAGREDNDLGMRISDFINKIARWKREERQMNLFEFMWQILNETGFYYYICALPNGDSRQQNIKYLVDMAEEFEKSGFSERGLYAFLVYIEKLAKAGDSIAIPKASYNNMHCVQMMSIHRSKGLEFPIVILAGLGKQFNLQDARAKILMHKKYGIGLRYVDWKSRVYSDTLGQMIIKKELISETLAEEIRILYVAMTRAVDRLVMVGSTSDINTSLTKWHRGANLANLSLAKSNLDWLAMILMGEEVSSDWHVVYWTKTKIIENNDLFDNTILQSLDDQHVTYKQEKKDRIDLHLLPDENEFTEDIVYNEIKNRLDWQYPYAETQYLPFKLSVSELNQWQKNSETDDGMGNFFSYSDIPEMIVKPKFLEKNNIVSAVEIGTMYHFFMQIINLKGDLSSGGIQQQLNDFVKSGIMERNSLDILDAVKLSKFFESHLGKRLIHSKKVYREVPFLFKNKYKSGNILIQGVIDCYFEEDHNIILIDYKTDKNVSGKEFSHAKKYHKQIALYKEAIENLIKKPVTESYIYFIDSAVSVKIY